MTEKRGITTIIKKSSEVCLIHAMYQIWWRGRLWKTINQQYLYSQLLTCISRKNFVWNWQGICNGCYKLSSTWMEDVNNTTFASTFRSLAEIIFSKTSRDIPETSGMPWIIDSILYFSKRYTKFPWWLRSIGFYIKHFQVDGRVWQRK